MTSDTTSRLAPPDLLRGHLPHEHLRGWTLILVWAPWSARSLRLRQQLDTAVFPPRLKLLSLQVEAAVSIVYALAIPSTPYLLLLHGGREVARHPGDGPLPDLLEWVHIQRFGHPDSAH